MARATANPLEGVNVSKAVAWLQKNGTAEKSPSETKFAEALGIPAAKKGAVLWALEPQAFPELKIKGTPANIVKARNNGLRWERIAARTGMSVAQVQKAFEEHTGESAASSYTGRGRNYTGQASAKPEKKAASGRKPAATEKAGTSGRRAAASKPAASGGKPARARTRAERQAKAGKSPS